MATETTYNVIKVQELRAISSATGSDEIIINDVDSTPLETKKITVENFAYAIKDYVLPIASAEILGGIRVGEGLTIHPTTGVLRNDIYYINDLHDVQVVSPKANQILVYNGVHWTNSENSAITEIIAGDGLSGGGDNGSIIINVNPGDGISIENDRINVNTGLGLATELDVLYVDVNNSLTFEGNKLTVNPGSAIILDDNGVSVNYGRGLRLFGPYLEAYLGSGLNFAGDTIAVDVAEEALDTTPNPDTRVSGIVKLASVEEVEEGINKTNAVTPYTLNSVLKGAIIAPTDFIIQWQEDVTQQYVSIDSKLLNLSVLSDAIYFIDGQEIPALGEWTYEYYDVTNGDIGSGSEVRLFPKIVATDSGGYALQDSFISDFEINPISSERKLKVRGTFFDVYGNTNTVDTKELRIKYTNAMKITKQPEDINTQAVVGPFSSSVKVEPYSTELPFDASKIQYQWYIFDIAVEGKNTPDLNYDFSGFETDTLTAKRINTGAETVQIRCEIRYGDDHPRFEAIVNENGKLVITTDTGIYARSSRSHDPEVKADLLISEPALLKGPSERIIKETTRTVVERQTVQTTAAPRVGSTFSTPSSGGGNLYLGVSVDQYGRVRGLSSGSSRLKVATTRQIYCGKCSGISDRRLKKNIMPIGEYLS